MTVRCALGVPLLAVLLGLMRPQPNVVQLRYLLVRGAPQAVGPHMRVRAEALQQATTAQWKEQPVELVVPSGNDSIAACQAPPKALSCDVVRVMRKDTVMVGVRRTVFYVHISRLQDLDGEHVDELPLRYFKCDEPENEEDRDNCVNQAANRLAAALNSHYLRPDWGHTSAK